MRSCGVRILVSGSTGLIGGRLVPTLEAAGHQVRRLVRSPGITGQVYWDPGRDTLDSRGLEGVDAVVHLAGEPLASRRWSPSQRRRILDSRVVGTRLLSSAVSELRSPPKVMVSGSAIGWYGDRGDEQLSEESPPGEGFLAEVCAAWEASATPAAAAGTRVVNLRSGVVLSRSGGALARQLPLFRLGLGGRLGSGRQVTSWISLEDEVGAIVHCLESEALEGPVNATAPAPVTNAELTRALARQLNRPALIPVPRIALYAALGPEMARQVALVSQRVMPTRLLATGYRFRHPDIDSALAAALA